jgi:purine nucleoside phosphorylase
LVQGLGYWLDNPGFEFWLVEEILLFSKMSRHALGPTQSPNVAVTAHTELNYFMFTAIRPGEKYVIPYLEMKDSNFEFFSTDST